jgi:hypothetical protein
MAKPNYAFEKRQKELAKKKKKEEKRLKKNAEHTHQPADPDMNPANVEQPASDGRPE